MEVKELTYPLVSILIPTYNRPELFEIALKSACQQTYKNIEIIVSDDGTDNRTYDLIQPYLKNDNRIKYLKSPNLNVNQNWQVLIDNISPESKYVNFLMDDDIFAPDKIEKMIAYYMDNSEISLVTSYRQRIDINGNKLPDTIDTKSIADEDCIYDGEMIGRLVLKNFLNFIGEPTTMLLKKEQAKKLAYPIYFGKRFNVCSIPDVIIALNSLLKGKMVYLSEPLSFFRSHAQQGQNEITLRITGLENWWDVIKLSYENNVFFRDKEDFTDTALKWIKLAESFFNNVPHDLIEKGSLKAYYKEAEGYIKIDSIKNPAIDLFEFIPPDAGVVLDFREYDADLAARMKMQNPDCVYLALAFQGLLGGEADCILTAAEKIDFDLLLQYLSYLKPEGQMLLALTGEHDLEALGRALLAQEIGIYQIIPLSTEKDTQVCILRIAKSIENFKPMLLQTFLGETMVCARVRIIEPHNFLRTIPLVQTENIKERLNLDSRDKVKILIRQRTFVRDRELLMQQLKVLRDNAYLTIAEMDDDPLRWEREYRANDFLPFRGCHAVMVSTPALAEFMRQFNPHVKCFPNQLAYLPLWREEETKDKPLNIFFGALNRERDYAPLLPAINELAREYKDRIHFRVIYDKQFFAALKTENKDFLPFSDYRTYEAVLHSCHIAILPLEDNHFNRMKSDLKFIECAGHGCAVLASPVVYGETVIHGKTGYIYHDEYEFKAYFAKLVEDEAVRNSIRKNAYNYVRQERLLVQHYRERYEWYMSLYSKLPELDRQLMERIG